MLSNPLLLYIDLLSLSVKEANFFLRLVKLIYLSSHINFKIYLFLLLTMDKQNLPKKIYTHILLDSE